MEELKWPVTKCENPECGFDFREAKPGQLEKGNDINGRLIWNAHCPKCGRGYEVGDRVLPAPTAEVLAERDAAPALAYAEAKDLAKEVPQPSGVPPDKRGAALAEENPDPEGLINKETDTTVAEETQETGAVRPPGKGEYFCTKCVSCHREDSKKGKSHTKYREA